MKNNIQPKVLVKAFMLLLYKPIQSWTLKMVYTPPTHHKLVNPKRYTKAFILVPLSYSDKSERPVSIIILRTDYVRTYQTCTLFFIFWERKYLAWIFRHHKLGCFRGLNRHLFVVFRALNPKHCLLIAVQIFTCLINSLKFPISNVEKYI